MDIINEFNRLEIYNPVKKTGASRNKDICKEMYQVSCRDYLIFQMSPKLELSGRWKEEKNTIYT